jgi:hypothetical protein
VTGGRLVTFAGSRGSVTMLSIKLAAAGLGMLGVGSARRVNEVVIRPCRRAENDLVHFLETKGVATNG